MKIFIVSTPGANWKTLMNLLKSNLDEKVRVIHCEPHRPLHGPFPANTLAVFILVDEMETLVAARKSAWWDSTIPLAFVCKNPDYALEAIRLGAAHYLVEPLTSDDVNEALQRAYQHKKAASI